MPAQWTGDFVGQIHVKGLTIAQVAEEAGLSRQHVSWVLNQENPSEKTRKKLYAALDRIINRSAS